MKSHKIHEKPRKTNLEPWKTIKKTMKTMKNQPGIMKHHEKPWKINLEPTWAGINKNVTYWRGVTNDLGGG